MAIFTSDNKPINDKVAGAATIIAAGTRIKGDIDTDCHLHIDGEFDGILKSKNTVMIGKGGIARGEIYAQKLIVSGKFIGTSESKTIEIMSHGRFEGMILTEELVIERKGTFIGESKNGNATKLLDDGKKLEDASKKIAGK
ncbi:polymer-forming cytoskeletal protein [Helicobacter sp. 11S02629-2]|uniref:bactofilin family protein n=1 Tax=Helicobacter sp. 11S02629-2 TaxID=1476195 RepID=UPI000BA761BE|nr:polymer-forming cytoskeletal protein [Helicobacter sp. 11S02629-2]PAF45879.1 polymer-forming cytoskeletal family protein [Helicobacter sp. 11S02629-2]